MSGPRASRAASRAAQRWGGRLLLLASALVLAGCGFQLRGTTAQLPPVMAQTYVSGVPSHGELGLALRQGLTQAGAQPADVRAAATALLIIESENMQRRVVSVDRTGKVNEYELNYLVRFQVRDAQDRVLLPSDEVLVAREYSFDADQVLAKDLEEASLRRDMVAAVVQRILQRINVGLRGGA